MIDPIDTLAVIVALVLSHDRRRLQHRHLMIDLIYTFMVNPICAVSIVTIIVSYHHDRSNLTTMIDFQPISLPS